MIVSIERQGRKYTLEVLPKKPFPACFSDGEIVQSGVWNGDFVELDATTSDPYPHAKLLFEIGVYDALEAELKSELRRAADRK